MGTLDAVRERARFRGCLLGGAVGDALGAPVEFMRRAEIIEHFGPPGITCFVPAYGGLGTITDDTQMALFTAEGLIRAWVRGQGMDITSYLGVVANAYLRWLSTQGERPVHDVALVPGEPGWLFQQRELHNRRAPGVTCLSALRAMRRLGQPASNDSKGCGGVMRMAPAGLFAARAASQEPLRQAFALGAELAALTHGHPTGALAAGVLAALTLALAGGGSSLTASLAAVKPLLCTEARHEETLHALEAAEALAGSCLPAERAIAQLGEGWVAEEALGIAVYCALVARDFEHGVVLAVNHDGDSDSTGAITGNLLGALLGEDAIPAAWLGPLELRPVITELADDLYACTDWPIGTDQALSERVSRKYPGF